MFLRLVIHFTQMAASTYATTVYERDACLDFIHGQFVTLTEFCCETLDLTWNYHERKLNVWAGCRNAKAPQKRVTDSGDDVFDRAMQRQAPRNHRTGPVLTAEEGRLLTQIIELQARTSEAQATADRVLGNKFKTLATMKSK